MSSKLLAEIATRARSPVLIEHAGAPLVANFVRDHLRVDPGSRCVVVATASARRRAAIVPHFLRRGGFHALQLELPDSAPTEAAVSAAVDAARRTGATFIVAYGGSAAASIGRAAAALAANGGRLADYAPELGGRTTLQLPSMPFLAVPSCPAGGAELDREAVLLAGNGGGRGGGGGVLATLRSHRASHQAALVDPALAVSLAPEAVRATGFATLVHCAEAFLRLDSDAPSRTLALEGVRRAVWALPASLSHPTDARPRAELALASLIAGALRAGGERLGAARGLALAVSARYRVSYADALTAVAPEALSASLDVALERYEEDPDDIEEDDKDGAEREFVDAIEGLAPRSAAMRARLAKARREDAAADAEVGADSEMRALLAPYAAAADAALRGGGRISGGDGAAQERALRSSDMGLRMDLSPPCVDDDAVETIVRFARLSGLLRRVTTGVGGDDGHVGRDLEDFGLRLRDLRSCGEAAGVPRAPSLQSLGLAAADYAAVAAAANVDANVVANCVSLRVADLNAILERS